MSTNETSGQESSGTDRQPATRNELAAAATEKTLKRARWEHLRLAACPGARRVNVCNYSYGVAGVRGGEHTYTVTIAVDGQPADCTCPAAEYQPGPCKHAVAVADAPDVLDEAMHGEPEPVAASDADGERAVADGGTVADGETDDGETCGRCPMLLADAHAEPAGYTVITTDGEELCPECADARSGEEIGFVDATEDGR